MRAWAMSRGGRQGDYPSTLAKIYDDWLSRRQGLLVALTQGARCAVCSWLSNATSAS